MSEQIETRNRKVLEAAVAMACESGFGTLTRDAVAARAGVGAGSVNNAFGSMEGVRVAVLNEAVRRAKTDPETPVAVYKVIGQAIAAGHPAANGLQGAVRENALSALGAAN